MKRFNGLFSKPHVELRPWVIWTWNLDITKSLIEQQMNALAETGTAGVAIVPGRDLRPAFMSEDFLKLFEIVLSTAHEKGIGVRLVADLSMPCTTGIEHDLWHSSALRGCRLTVEYTERVAGKTLINRNVANPADVVAVAAKLVDGRVASVADVKPLSVSKGVLNWTAPAGEWQVWLLRKEFECDTSGAYIPNVYSAAAATAYTNAVLRPLRERFPRYMSSTFKGTVLEMPFVMPREGSIPWDDDLVVKYRSRFKKELVCALPVLFGDAVDSVARLRAHVYTYLQESMYERFSSTLDSYLRKYHLSQWLLAAERHAGYSSGVLKDFFAIPATECSAAGLQCLDGQDEDYAVMRTIASMNEVEFRRETIAVVGRSLSRTAPTPQSIRSELDQAIAAGANHILVDGFYTNLDHRLCGKAGYGPFWYSADLAGLKTIFSTAGYFKASLDKLHTAPQVAVLFPALSVLSDYRPGHDDALKKAAALLRRTLRTLRDGNVEFDVIGEDFLLKSSVRQNGEFGTADRVRKGNYQVLIIPYARLISRGLLVFVEKLAVKKGTVVFLDDAPQGDLDGAGGRVFIDRIEKLLEQRKNAIRVVPARDLLTAIGPVEQVARTLVNAAPCADIQVRQFTGEGGEVYCFRNASATQDYYVTIGVPSHRSVNVVLCENAEVHEHPAVESVDGKSVFGLMFSPLQSHVVAVTAAKLSPTKVSKERKRAFTNTTITSRSYRMVLKNQWVFMPVSPNILPLSGWNMRIGLSRESGGFSHVYETSFFVNEVPQRCFFVANGFPRVGQEYGGIERCLELTVNGTRMNLIPGSAAAGISSDPTYAQFRDMLVCELKGRLVQGPNRVLIHTAGRIAHPLPVLYPPVLAGEFSVKKDSRGWVIDEALQEVMHDSWTSHGFPYLSGVGEYRHVFEVPNKYEGLVLRFSSVSGSVTVIVNDAEVGTIKAQPMELDITDFCTQKRNELRLRITNTIDNFLRLNARGSGVMGEAYVDVY